MQAKELNQIIKALDFANIKAFARFLGVHAATVYRWRNGEIPIPEISATAIRLLARDKGVDVMAKK